MKIEGKMRPPGNQIGISGLPDQRITSEPRELVWLDIRQIR